MHPLSCQCGNDKEVCVEHVNAGKNQDNPANGFKYLLIAGQDPQATQPIVMAPARIGTARPTAKAYSNSVAYTGDPLAAAMPSKIMSAGVQNRQIATETNSNALVKPGQSSLAPEA